MIGSRGLYVIASAVVSVVVAFLFPGALQSSMTALEGIISVFSILAGVLVAVMSIIGDPSMLLSGNWRIGYEHAKDIQKRIGNYANLIAIYVLILIGVLIAIIMKDNAVQGFQWFYAVLLGITTWGLLLSLPLPYSLMAIQKERMDEEVKRRKAFPTNAKKNEGNSE